ncbi:MAG: phosphate ABC transporter permease PstA [Rhizobiaceae bacterium]|nr:phosphate ABC transporter permease PstA [Rhizobiaceae bacterium]
MTDATIDGARAPSQAVKRRDIGLKERYAAEARFKTYGILAISVGIIFLCLLLGSIISQGYTAFWQTEIRLDVTFDEQVIDPDNQRAENPNYVARPAPYARLARDALLKTLAVDPNDRQASRRAADLLSDGAAIQLSRMVAADLSLLGQTRPVWVYASGAVDSVVKGQFDVSIDESRRPIKNDQLAWIRTLQGNGMMEQHFNSGLFTSGASSRAETAGVGAAIVGSFFMMMIVLVLALPIGVAASIYLEEFAPKNRLTDLIEVNINNLAAVPSIVYGILGLAVFIGYLGMPRSASLVGGLVLTLMTLPTIIIATRAALKAVPPSIRAAALGLGASKMQMVFHHVLPLAAPGVLTGTIIGLAHALGETAPLLLIGMKAFVADAPSNPLDASSALPVQIYRWSIEADRAFVERTSGAIIVLLLFLAVMNLSAILLRRRFERRW